jgi:hypothetical protein
MPDVQLTPQKLAVCSPWNLFLVVQVHSWLVPLELSLACEHCEGWDGEGRDRYIINYEFYSSRIVSGNARRLDQFCPKPAALISKV